MNSPVPRRTVLGIIPARGGSKGIARKNIRLLCGKPLIAYSAAAALESACLNRVLLSTDDHEIARVGRELGLDVPFLRPSELAADSTPMIAVVLHAIQWVKKQGKAYDAICLLQPTSPLRSPRSIDRCISLLWERDVDTVISVRPVPPEYNPHWVYFETADGLLHRSMGACEPIPVRQKLPPAYHCDGSVFVSRTQVVITYGSLYGTRTLGSVSPEEEAFDLDTEEQWAELEQKLKSTSPGR